MPNLNSCQMMGHLTDVPKLRTIPSGTSVAEFSLAVHRHLKGGEEDVLFMPVTVWGKMGESCANHLQKGSCALVVGYLKQENWQTPEGQRRTIIKLVAEEVQFITRAGQSGQQRNTAAQISDGGHRYTEADLPPPQQPAAAGKGVQDDIPF